MIIAWPDVRLPQRNMREITVLALATFTGRWVAEHRDSASGTRYSVAILADRRYIVIAKFDDREAVDLQICEDLHGMPQELAAKVRMLR